MKKHVPAFTLITLLGLGVSAPAAMAAPTDRVEHLHIEEGPTGNPTWALQQLGQQIIDNQPGPRVYATGGRGDFTLETGPDIEHHSSILASGPHLTGGQNYEQHVNLLTSSTIVEVDTESLTYEAFMIDADTGEKLLFIQDGNEQASERMKIRGHLSYTPAETSNDMGYINLDFQWHTYVAHLNNRNVTPILENVTFNYTTQTSNGNTETRQARFTTGSHEHGPILHLPGHTITSCSSSGTAMGSSRSTRLLNTFDLC